MEKKYTLFNNAVASLKLGLEDFAISENSPERILSSCRNYYAGIILLAKEVLVQSASNVEPERVLYESFEPVLNPDGQIEFKPKNNQKTIGIDLLKKRLGNFGVYKRITGLKDEMKNLKGLRDFRNDLEHHAPKEGHKRIKEEIAKNFNLVDILMKSLKKETSKFLGEACWGIMLKNHEFYKKIHTECLATFSKFVWPEYFGNEFHVSCPICSSNLVEQKDATNDDYHAIKAKCRSCGSDAEAESIIKKIVSEALELPYEPYESDDNIAECPHCCLFTPVISFTAQDDEGHARERFHCIWCEDDFTKCIRCETYTYNIDWFCDDCVDMIKRA